MQQFMEEHKLEPHARSGRPSRMDPAMMRALDKIATKTRALRVRTFKLGYWPRQADE
jgi:hypothetical protein